MSKPCADAELQYATLVGGFGSSRYLREYLMHHCQGVEVLQCRGWQP